MLIILGLYFGLVWLIFSKLKLLTWNGFWKALVYTGAVVIALVVIGALNHTAPTGRVSVQGIPTNIVPNVAGRVIAVEVNPNQQVKEGDVLFRIDDTVYAAEVARLEAALKSAETAADQLTLDLEAAEADIAGLQAQLTYGIQRRDDIVRLEERGATTGFQMQDVVSSIDQLTAAIRAAEARKTGLERRIATRIDGQDVAVAEVTQALKAARWNLEQTVTRAPADGVVTAVSLRPGNRVTTAQGAISFAKPEDRILIATLPQSSRGNVAVGDEIRIALRTSPGTEFTSRIQTIPLGSAEGTLDLRTGLPRLRELAGVSQFAVTIDPPQNADIISLPYGASGTALVKTDKAGPIGILAEVLFWVTKMMNYL